MGRDELVDDPVGWDGTPWLVDDLLPLGASPFVPLVPFTEKSGAMGTSRQISLEGGIAGGGGRLSLLPVTRPLGTDGNIGTEGRWLTEGNPLRVANVDVSVLDGLGLAVMDNRSISSRVDNPVGPLEESSKAGSVSISSIEGNAVLKWEIEGVMTEPKLPPVG